MWCSQSRLLSDTFQLGHFHVQHHCLHTRFLAMLHHNVASKHPPIWMRHSSQTFRTHPPSLVHQRVDDLACQPGGKTSDGYYCSVVGSHGVAVIDIDDTTLASTVRWSADVPIYSGERSPPSYFNYSYSMCAGWIYNWYAGIPERETVAIFVDSFASLKLCTATAMMHFLCHQRFYCFFFICAYQGLLLSSGWLSQPFLPYRSWFRWHRGCISRRSSRVSPFVFIFTDVCVGFQCLFLSLVLVNKHPLARFDSHRAKFGAMIVQNISAYLTLDFINMMFVL